MIVREDWGCWGGRGGGIEEGLASTLPSPSDRGLLIIVEKRDDSWLRIIWQILTTFEQKHL